MSSLTIADGKAKIKKLLKKAQVYEVGIVDSIIDGVFSEMNLDTKPSKSIEEAVVEIGTVQINYVSEFFDYHERDRRLTEILQSIDTRQPSKELMEKVEELPITTLATGKNGAWVTYIDKDSVLSLLEGDKHIT